MLLRVGAGACRCWCVYTDSVCHACGFCVTWMRIDTCFFINFSCFCVLVVVFIPGRSCLSLTSVICHIILFATSLPVHSAGGFGLHVVYMDYILYTHTNTAAQIISPVHTPHTSVLCYCIDMCFVCFVLVYICECVVNPLQWGAVLN